jgi:hypothetical protein
MSTVILDTITGKSTATTITIGSTPVVSASANSMTIRGEGSAQTSIQQGLLKCWVNFDGTGTIAARDSFNLTSLTDNGTGSYNVTIANNLANDDFTVTSGGAGTEKSIGIDQHAVTSFRTFNYNGDGNAEDNATLTYNIAGDLA